MTHVDIVRLRLHNQLITQHLFEKPVDVVQWMGAVQSQDYAAAKWAIGLRLQHATDNAIEQAFADGTILRTHVMRSTWHFVSPDDIRWLLALTAPQVNAALASYYHQFELDDAIFERSNAALIQALQGGKQFTRSEIAAVLKQATINVDNLLRLGHLIIHAELDGVICSGARRGKQFTYALLDERVPPTRALDRDEALVELARRYFTSHGPATLRDFVWWSGLRVADARAALTMVSSQLMHESIDGQTYWFTDAPLPTKDSSPTIHLLPNFDEYIVGYTDRRAIWNASYTQKLDGRKNFLFNHTIVIDGQVVGTWKRTINKNTCVLIPSFFTPLNESETRIFAASMEQHGAFLEKTSVRA